jgi:hypothetical protein
MAFGSLEAQDPVEPRSRVTTFTALFFGVGRLRQVFDQEFF